MEALLYSIHPDETNLLTFVLQQAGLIVHSDKHLDPDNPRWLENPPNILLITLPEESTAGLELVQRLRVVSRAPLAVVCDHYSEDALIQLYRTGADLIVTRPFSARIFSEQIRALLRRSNQAVSFEAFPIENAGIRLDSTTHQVWLRDSRDPQHLTNLEFRLLHTLMVHAGHVVPNEFLVNSVWGYAGDTNRELVRGVIQRLRAKLETDPHQPHFIQTEPGIGYWFNPSIELLESKPEIE